MIWKKEWFIYQKTCYVDASPSHAPSSSQTALGLQNTIQTYKTQCYSSRVLHKPLHIHFPLYLWMGAACPHAFFSLIFAWDLPTVIPAWVLFFLAITAIIFIKEDAIRNKRRKDRLFADVAWEKCEEKNPPFPCPCWHSWNLFSPTF